ADEDAGAAQALRELAVVLARLGIAAGMVVDEDGARGALAQERGEDIPRLEVDRAAAAVGEAELGDHARGAAEREADELLALELRHAPADALEDGVRPEDALTPIEGPLGEAAGERERRLDPARGGWADAGDLGQLLDAGDGHAPQVGEARDE